MTMREAQHSREGRCHCCPPLERDHWYKKWDGGGREEGRKEEGVVTMMAFTRLNHC
jgi:hypothetical protein